ncbi:unnamed protein product [Ilex paraguariensis]|uniref:DDT domain-containing protein n=1 Tax=Ilex paraguariensis TaxID=185542 RepID=A0ABC8V3Z3_9AQUA
MVKKRKKQQLICVDNVDRIRLQQVWLSPDDILKKVFRKDGPPVGVEFDSLPSQAFKFYRKGSKKSHRSCQGKQRPFKRRKVCEPTSLDYQVCIEKSFPKKKHGIGKGLMNASVKKHSIGKGLIRGPVKKHGIGKGLMGVPAKKHGVGKGLMTIWQATNPEAGEFPTRVEFSDRALFQMGTAISTKPIVQEKKKRVQRRQPVARRLVNESQDKRKPFIKSRKKECQKIEKAKPLRREKCELALEGLRCEEELDQFALLVDDEELELRELQAGTNPLMCSAHFGTNGLHGCSLCKDLLATFPPDSVTMKPPLCMQPWISSPELVKKIFKVFHFLCTYAAKIGICSFTLDEFAQAFHDKDSLLLGKVHVALLKLLLSDVEMELNSEFSPHTRNNWRFLGVLQSVEHQEFVLKFWQKALNPLTWIEILYQVLIAAGFGSKHGTLPREPPNKEVNLMVKYGLSPHTLKCQLFSILLMQGNNGLKVSELAQSSAVLELNLAAKAHELELLISSTLSGDITLFEKISSSAYRIRINSVKKESEDFQSDSEDFGSVDDDSKDVSGCSNADDSEYDSGTSIKNKLEHRNSREGRNNMLTVYNEIDESNPGEAWLLGLVEGEYSDLSIDEKLEALVALLELLSAGSSIRMEVNRLIAVWYIS